MEHPQDQPRGKPLFLFYLNIYFIGQLLIRLINSFWIFTWILSFSFSCTSWLIIEFISSLFILKLNRLSFIALIAFKSFFAKSLFIDLSQSIFLLASSSLVSSTSFSCACTNFSLAISSLLSLSLRFSLITHLF